MSHEVLIILGVTTIKLCIVKLILHLRFQSTAGHDSFLLLLSFVLLSKEIKLNLKNVNEAFYHCCALVMPIRSYKLGELSLEHKLNYSLIQLVNCCAACHKHGGDKTMW